MIDTNTPKANGKNGEVKQLPANVERDVLRLLCTYLLWEKKNESDLQIKFMALVAERHAHFHNAEVAWSECRNEICVEAKHAVENLRKPEVQLTPMAGQLISDYAIHFTWSEGAIRAALEKKPDMMQSFLGGERPAGSLIVRP